MVAVQKLTRRRQFLAANSGIRVATAGFVLLVQPRKAIQPATSPQIAGSAHSVPDHAGVGITVTKKIGNAVVRNRMKRRFRALSQELFADHAVPGADHVLIGRAGGVERPYDQLRGDLRHALGKAQRLLAQGHSGQGHSGQGHSGQGHSGQPRGDRRRDGTRRVGPRP